MPHATSLYGREQVNIRTLHGRYGTRNRDDLRTAVDRAYGVQQGAEQVHPVTAVEQMARAAAVAGPKAPHGAELSGHESGQTAFHPSAGHGGHHCGDLAVREKVVDVPSGPCRDPTAL